MIGEAFNQTVSRVNQGLPTMFQHIAAQAPDPILSLMRQARQDANPDKIDLTIGVYFDDHGNTPIMRAVKAAEAMRT